MSRFPDPLTKGGHLRVIAPSDSLARIESGEEGKFLTQLATQRLNALGFEVTFGEHVRDSDRFGSTTVKARLADWHEAFADPEVNGIISVIGGSSSHELLPFIDFELIKANPKIFCGYSDITALQNAIYAKTGLVSYSGPHWVSFGMRDHSELMQESFMRAVTTGDDIEWSASDWFTDDLWFLDQDARTLEATDGWWVIQKGEAAGVSIGSNLSTLALLNGSMFLPRLNGSILFAEVTMHSDITEFRRQLVSVLHQPGGDKLCGLVIGRFQNGSPVAREDIEEIVSALPQ